MANAYITNTHLQKGQEREGEGEPWRGLERESLRGLDSPLSASYFLTLLSTPLRLRLYPPSLHIHMRLVGEAEQVGSALHAGVGTECGQCLICQTLRPPGEGAFSRLQKNTILPAVATLHTHFVFSLRKIQPTRICFHYGRYSQSLEPVSVQNRKTPRMHSTHLPPETPVKEDAPS